MKTALLILAVLWGGYLLLTQVNRDDNIPTKEGGTIPISYARQDKADYLKERATHIRYDVSVNQGPVTIGSKAVISKWMWATVENKKPLTQRFSNGDSKLRVGETCGVEFGGSIIVVGIEGENLLVEYFAPGDPMGTPCPSGVRFLISKISFAAMNEEYTTKRDAILAEKELVKKLLAQGHRGESVNAGVWRWVDVVNLDPIVQQFSNGHAYLGYGDTCGVGLLGNGEGSISTGGTIEERGKVAGKVLYEYTASGNPKGTPCPSGVLFFGH